MSRSPERRTGVAALRPWPFGPPLRGRAPRSNAGPLAAPGLGMPPCGQPNGAFQGRQALAPVGGLACPPPPRCVSR